MGEGQAEKIIPVLAQEAGQVEFLGDGIQNQQRTEDGDLVDFRAFDGSGQKRTVIDLFTDIPEMPLDDLAVDTDVFDFGQVDGVAPFDFSDEAHSVYSIHYGGISQVPDIPQILDFPGGFRHLDCSGYF